MKLSFAAESPELYPDRHLNIFVPYGTHELDYNVTRAMICALRWSAPDLVRDFLKEVMAVEVNGEVPALYDLQACDYDGFDTEACETRKLLGVSRAGKIAERLPAIDQVDQSQILHALRAAVPEERLARARQILNNSELTADDVEVLEHTLEEYERGSMPDGWIFTADGKVCVLIEAKLTHSLDQYQLDRHAETWYGEPCRGDDLVLATWRRLAAFFEARRDHADPRTAFLCRQFVDYLELLGQAPFDGFKPYDLDGDALLGSLPKLMSFSEVLIAAGQSAGIPLGPKVAPSGSGIRIGFGDPSLVGALGVELNDDSVSFLYTIGEQLDGQALAGAEGADKMLDSCQNGLVNPLADIGEITAGQSVRVDRLVWNNGHPAHDRPVYTDDFKPEEFSEVLEELSGQHPPAERRQSQGRSGVLTISRSLEGPAAMVGKEAILEAGLNAFREYLKIARAVSG